MSFRSLALRRGLSPTGVVALDEIEASMRGLSPKDRQALMEWMRDEDDATDQLPAPPKPPSPPNALKNTAPSLTKDQEPQNVREFLKARLDPEDYKKALFILENYKPRANDTPRAMDSRFVGSGSFLSRFPFMAPFMGRDRVLPNEMARASKPTSAQRLHALVGDDTAFHRRFPNVRRIGHV
jgi:hypothetical protein